MKKLFLVLVTFTTLALITSACSCTLLPPVVDQGPLPGQPQPGQPEQPQPGQPQPEQPLPGQPQPEPPQPGQPQPGLPPASGPTALPPAAPGGGASGPTAVPPAAPGGGASIATTAAPSGGIMIVVTQFLANFSTLDLAISNIYPASTGHIMVTLKNAGTQTIAMSPKLTCYGTTTGTTGVHTVGPYAQYPNINLAAGKTTDIDTSFSRDPSITTMYVSCTIIPPSGDTNSSNDTMGLTQVK